MSSSTQRRGSDIEAKAILNAGIGGQWFWKVVIRGSIVAAGDESDFWQAARAAGEVIERETKGVQSEAFSTN